MLKRWSLRSIVPGVAAAALLFLAPGCGSETPVDNDETTGQDTGNDTTNPPPDEPGKDTKDPPPDEKKVAKTTYYQHAGPLMLQKCGTCHQQGGIAPFRVDVYADAAKMAKLIKERTGNRTMPPYFVDESGDCGTYDKSLSLTQDEIDLLAAWVDEGAAEGTVEELKLPPVQGLPAPTADNNIIEFETPEYIPDTSGDNAPPLKNWDPVQEWRCFTLENPLKQDVFITAWDVIVPERVHHTVFFTANPDRVITPYIGNNPQPQTIREWIDAYEGVDKTVGYPCFGWAGFVPDSVPVVQSPGTNPVYFPKGTGLQLAAGHILFMQVHSRSDRPEWLGKPVPPVKTRFQIATTVERPMLQFVMENLLLENYVAGAEPPFIPGGMKEYVNTRTIRIRDLIDGVYGAGTTTALGLDPVPLEMLAVSPHMHYLGTGFNLTLGDKADTANPPVCTSALRERSWDVRWELMYFLDQKSRTPMNVDTPLNFSCIYDTSSRNEDIQAGFGTDNEMCATTFIVAPQAAP